MAIGTSKEDLGAFSREDLVYKAKLAEQAERCVRSCARRRSFTRRRRRGSDDDDDLGFGPSLSLAGGGRMNE